MRTSATFYIAQDGRIESVSLCAHSWKEEQTVKRVARELLVSRNTIFWLKRFLLLLPHCLKRSLSRILYILIAEIGTRLPFSKTLSLLLDRLIVASESDDNGPS
ncbi:MAG: hypothetical protein C4576_25495 [Desulfobacteraceae bacterium]|nr:MAG: hypothetical protein C4576_25495 [Desulfobacteraceae bacterium]